jgi:hypothetical protein
MKLIIGIIGLIVAFAAVAFNEPGPPPRVYDDTLKRFVDPPEYQLIAAAYVVDVQTAEGVPLAHFAAPNLDDVKANLRSLLILHCHDRSRAVVCRIWDRAATKWISLSGAQVNPIGGWIPCKVSVNVGSANL